ncbi:MAG: hypothetical protein AB8H12_00345 [Lewinella sp.]
MSTSDNLNWESQWQKELDGHTPLPTTEDWRGMDRLLDRKVPALAEHVIEQEPIGYDPWRSTIKRNPELGGAIWIGLVLFVTALGIWLLSTQGEVVPQEKEAISMARDSFPPKYGLNRYWTFDRDGNRVGEMNTDTIWLDHQVRKRGPHVLISPGKVSDYRIDTVLQISGKGAPLSIRYDTVAPPLRKPGELVIWGIEHRSIHDDCTQDILYVVDTVYALDELGNLTDKIISVDSTIIYSPGL